jgi:hypothetical protein
MRGMHKRSAPKLQQELGDGNYRKVYENRRYGGRLEESTV